MSLFVNLFIDLCSKEKIIEDMKLTLEEQEQTQSEQDQQLEARFEENNKLMAGKL